jgi:hypothetical protein
MSNNHPLIRHLVERGEQFLGHTLAVALGFVLMIVGLAMGVTMVLLPLGVPVGLVGLLIFVWGLTGHIRFKQT